MLLDVGAGLIGAIIFARAYGVPLDVSMVGVFILFALLPDLDFMVQWLRRGSIFKLDASHRDLLHYPLWYLPIGAVAITLWDERFVWPFFLLSLFHFLHDSIGIGWGVRWWYPYSNRSYKFFSEHDGRFSWNFMTAWTPQEQRALEARSSQGPHWIRRIYLRPHPINLIESAGFVIAVGIFVYYYSL